MPSIPLTKLNPTTITVTSSTAPDGGKTLKLSISPHLSVQSPVLDPPITKARKDVDALFEVLVPVGGRVEVKIEVDGLDHLRDTTARIWHDHEVEAAIMEQIKKLFEVVS